MATLLIVHHSPTNNTKNIFNTVLEGANTPEIEGVQTVTKEALTATSKDILDADAILLGTTANFGYISGALKHFFDSTFYEVHEETKGKPFSFWIHGGFDTTGAETAMRSITTGYGWRIAANPLIFTGELTPELRDNAFELGANMAATAL